MIRHAPTGRPVAATCHDIIAPKSPSPPSSSSSRSRISHSAGYHQHASIIIITIIIKSRPPFASTCTAPTRAPSARAHAQVSRSERRVGARRHRSSVRALLRMPTANARAHARTHANTIYIPFFFRSRTRTLGARTRALARIAIAPPRPRSLLLAESVDVSPRSQTVAGPLRIRASCEGSR